MANVRETRIDPELVNLSGGAFDGLPRTQVELEVFRLHVDGEPTPITRRPYDSLAPLAMVPGAPRATPEVTGIRRASWAIGLAVMAGMVGMGAGAIGGMRARTAPAAAARAVVAPAAQAMTPEKAADQPSCDAPKAITPGASVKVEPRAPRAATRPAVAAVAPTADLPPVTPVAALPVPTGEISRSAAAKSINEAARRAAASCRGEDAGVLNVPVSVTFASSGRATTARVNGGPLVGTAAGSCLATALRGASVPPFEGAPVTVNVSLNLR
ncbi:MAG: hypothetical protein QM820_28640 [Minicystis sp.]